MSRIIYWLKQFVICALLGLFILTLLMRVGGGFIDSNKVHIRWWNMFAGPDGQHALGMVRSFNQSHSNIHVSMQRMDFNTFYSKVFVAGLGGRSPEVFVVHADLLPRFVEAGLVRSLDDLIDQSDIELNDFNSNVLETVIFDKKVFGIPLDIHPMGMYYNATLLEKSGIIDEFGKAKPPETSEEFIDALQKLSSDDHRAFVLTWARINMYTVMRQFNGEMFNEDFSICTLNSDENIRALEYIVELIYEHKLIPKPQNIDPYTGFKQGKVGMVFEGPWMIHDFMKQNNFKVKVSKIPMIGEQHATWTNSHCIVIRSDISDKKLDAAWALTEYLSNNSLQWANGGQVPARKSVRESEGFKAMSAQMKFAEQIDHAVYFPRVQFLFEFLAEFDLAIERALTGKMSPTEALNHATERINETIKRHKSIYIK
ncbi:ABC transporter substrate-binding protein [Planctomycetota bacterium]|nr:ABC transporter substrate-binding protein [Planctomycetota bacterium]